MASTFDPSELHILIVDDEEDIVEVVGHFLRQEGFNVHKAYAGNEALEKASPEIDLIVLDIMLPEMDGFEVCRRIKSNESTRHIPVIMLTAKKSREDMARGETVGADWYITKPFKSAMVIETIQRFLAK